MKITILGAGAWGTALAKSLAERHEVLLWGRDAAAMRAIAAQRENRHYLPGFSLPDSLQCSADLEAAVTHAGTDGLMIAGTSLAGLRPLSMQLRSYAIPNLLWLCKGFEQDTQLMPHQVVREVLGDKVPVGALSGPSFAQEVALGLPCALTIASDHAGLRDQVVNAMHGRSMRIYATDDLIGVEVGGAVKNILAIATGVTDGLGLGMNARAALITRGLAEITRLGVALGGRAETFTGLAGIGDLILTCTGDLSRNRRVGLSLAEGNPLQTIVTELGHVAEGVRCAQAVRALALVHKVEMPITNAVASVLFDGVAPRDMVALLLARDPRDESRVRL
ncbi:MAG TPA: NAD(P)H-dependent glycerol-3-phosphate dehydrogenase [Oxalicibacterium sp.]|nr:NAD(P)H-dependent glycerol-3-phosphate dehydrogenase [Oxalicibacterium sp.]